MAVYLAGGAETGGAPLATEQLFLLAAEPSPESTITLAELAGQQLVLPAPGNPLRDFVDAVARSHGLRLDVVLEVDGAQPRHNAVLSGIGGTIVGAQAVAEQRVDQGLSVREIVAPRLFRPIFVGARRDLDPALRDRMNALLRDAMLELGLSPP